MSRPTPDESGPQRPAGALPEAVSPASAPRPDAEIARLQALIVMREQEIARLRRAKGAALLRDTAHAGAGAELVPGLAARPVRQPQAINPAGPGTRAGRDGRPGTGAEAGSSPDVERLAMQLAALQSEVDLLAKPGLFRGAARVLGWPWRALRRAPRTTSDPALARSAAAQATDAYGERIASRMALAAQIDAQPLVESAAPRCCVVVVSSGDADRLQSCLGALSTTLQQVPYRVRVAGALVAAPADPLIEWLTAPAAAGDTLGALRGIVDDTPAEMIVLLSERLIAQPGWLAAIEETLARFPQAGAVACRVQDALGGLVSAGGLIGRDAACLPRRPPPEVDALDCVQVVDCTGPDVVAVRRSAWDRIRRHFDEQPALLSGNVLIALLLREIGQLVYYQPFARLIDLDPPAPDEARSGSAWSDTARRWQIVERFPADFVRLATANPALTPEPRVPTALLIDTRVPRPDQDSASVDVLWYLRMLAAFGYQVRLLVPCAAADRDLDIARLRGWGMRVEAVKDVDELIVRAASASADAALVVVRGASAAARIIPAIRAAGRGARCVFDPVGLGFLAASRAAISQGSGELMQQALDLRADELGVIAAADATILSTSIECDKVRALLPAARIRELPIPRRPSRTMRGFGSRSGVLFLGAFTQLHVVDAVHFLTGEVWPLVRRQLPLLTLSIAGSEPSDAILALHNPDKGISVLGQVTGLERVFDAHRLAVAPLRFGAGIKGSVVSSMLHGVPCVVTPMAAEGMGLRSGEDVLLAETAAGLATAIARLHEDRDLWVRLADQGFRKAAADYAVDKVARGWLELLVDIGAEPPRREVAAADFIAT